MTAPLLGHLIAYTISLFVAGYAVARIMQKRKPTDVYKILCWCWLAALAGGVVTACAIIMF